MDLDKVKKVWQEDTKGTNLDGNKIQKMLDNTRGRTALDKLIRYEKIGRNLLLVCTLLSSLFLKYGYLLFALYWVLLAPSIVWQFYKIKYLSKIDIANMDILSMSSAINKYKKYISYEFWIGMMWFTLFLLAFVFTVEDIPMQNLLKGDTMTIVCFGVVVALIILYVLYSYYFLYWKNIKKIQKSIAEVRYFEEGND